MSSTRVTRHVKAPRAKVYHALTDAHAVATWMVPNGMTSQVHTFEAREGGAFRISLTYDFDLALFIADHDDHHLAAITALSS